MFRLHDLSLAARGAGLGGHDESDNETVKAKSLGENEDENHADEKLGLLGDGADASVTNNANGHTGREAGETAGETSREVGKGEEERVAGRVNCAIENELKHM